MFALRPAIVRVSSAVCALFLSWGTCGWGEEAPSPEGLDFFERKIRPVLAEKCYKCHSAQAKTLRAGLLVDTRDGIRTGGDSGPAVVPGNLGESLLIEALKYESYEMPPEGKLPDQVINDFVTWVEMGAPDPREGVAPIASRGIDLEAGREFWSFRPVVAPAVPQARNADWGRDDIDGFLLGRMEQSGLTPVEDADRGTLLRRLSFDLTGLPPTPAELEEFLSDPRHDDAAVAAVVDRLLASPHFGARWGRHWLDIARFADSTGGGRSLLYQTSWRYRDYVIDSIQRDKPFDQFIREQIAGDLLPSNDDRRRTEQLTATAFLELGPTNYEEQDKLQLRMDVIDEQIDTVGRAFLGMTLGCARCHDHKFDPIPTRDYYALAGIFKSTQSLIDSNVSTWIRTPLPEPADVVARRDAYAAESKAVDQGIKTQTKEVERLRGLLPAGTIQLDDDAAVLEGTWKESKSTKGFVGAGYRYASGGDAQAVFEFRVSPGRYEVRATYTPGSNRSPDALLIVRHAGGETTTRIDQRQAGTVGGNAVSLGTFAFDAPPKVVVSTRGTRGIVVADSVQLIRVDEASTTDPAVVEARRLLAEAEGKLAELKQSQADLKKSAPEPAPDVVSVREAEEIGDAPVCIRGSARQLGESVPRGFLQVASRGEAPSIPETASGRLQLAEWIASPDNPLTARVFVNRVWSHLFGVGLVRTVDNFGATGETPSHPELLDHLAARFMREKWSLKTLVRGIVLSRAYRLASHSTTEANEADPENRLLSHQNRRRLEAEAIHDAVLSVSGRFDPAIGGPTMRPDTKSEYGYEFDYGRRAVYLPVFRNRLPELFTVFDFPDPNISNGRRVTTTLSTQALFLLNSPFVREQAQFTALRLMTEAETDEERVRLLYRRAFARDATASEIATATEFLSSGKDDEARLRDLATLCQAAFASIDFRYVD